VALNEWGLQCLTWALTAFGLIVIVLTVMIGAARLLVDSLPGPDDS